MKRREFIAFSGTVGIGLVSSPLVNAKRTPPQTEGPFYPILEQLDKDADMTVVEGGTQCAKGEKVYIRVLVEDDAGNPVSGALVELWQACSSGKYNHPGDPNPAPLDKNFQYWSRLQTDETGAVLVKTVIPGAYPASATWIRPAHIHFRVAASGHKTLTTQMYFKGGEHQQRDHILHETEVLYGKEAREQLIVDFDETKEDLPLGNFKVVMGKTPRVE
jgi:protocatechuate 3,4-dioxygenase beta subunit